MDISQVIQECNAAALAARSLNTARTYQGALKIFQEFLAEAGFSPDQPAEALQMEHFIKFPAFLAGLGYSKRSIGVYLGGARFLLDWLVINGLLRPDYSETLRYELAVQQIQKKSESRLPRVPEKGAVEKILQAIDNYHAETPVKERNIAIIYFLLTTGCRNNELVQLKVKDIDLKAQHALVLGKGQRERRVFFNAQTARALEAYWSARGFREKAQPAFARHDDGAGKKKQALTTTSIRNIVDDFALLAGLDKGSFTPHYFRHAFAIKMLQETHDLALVQDLLGHASPASTRVYAKIYPDDLEKAHRQVWQEPEAPEEPAS
jgi:site-specific recombinase XerD